MSESLAVVSKRQALPAPVGEELAPTPWLRITVVFVFARLLAFGWMFLAQLFVPAAETYKYGFAPNSHPLMKWDGSWYLDILQSGYWYYPHVQSSVAFFPAYPILTLPLLYLGIPAQEALLIAANLCCWLACFALWRLAADVHGRKVADLALVFFVCNPVVIFFMAAYTESSFVLFSALSLLWIRRHWPLALAAGVVAGATRSTGVLLALPMLIEAIALGRERSQRPFHGNWRLLSCVGPAIGLGSWCLYLQVRFGDPLAFAHVQEMWGRAFAPFWQVYGSWFPHGDFYDWLFLLSLLACMLFVGAAACLKLRLSWTIFSLLSMAVFMQSGSTEATPRFVFGMFSIYPAMALIADRFPATKPYLLMVSIQLALVSIALFTRGYSFT